MLHAKDVEKDAEAILNGISQAAHVAERFFTGRFADGAIENVALEIGQRLESIGVEADINQTPNRRVDSRRQILHVVSVVAFGGHMPFLYHWMQNDPASCHSIVLLNHRGSLPDRLTEAVAKQGGKLTVIPVNSSFMSRANSLRQLAKQEADLVLWHVICPDVLPVVAFATDQCPPVALIDHADHLFWLGSTVADIVVNLRLAGAKHSSRRRFAARTAVIPIPLRDRHANVSRDKARQKLGIEKNQVVLLSVGRALKYRPCGRYDFVATAGQILDHDPDAHLYVIGETPDGIKPYLRCAPHNRLHFMGSAKDPSLYLAAADIYLESFPYGSQTALLEAGLAGLPIVPAYAPLFPLLVANDDSLLDILPNPKNEQEYISNAAELIRNPSLRHARGKVLRDRILADHVGENWQKRLAELYKVTGALEHNPRPIPVSECTRENAGLSQWDAVADVHTSGTFVESDFESAVFSHKAFVAKYVGDYETARRFAWRAVLRSPSRWIFWRLFVIAMLGKPARSLRQCLRRA